MPNPVQAANSPACTVFRLLANRARSPLRPRPGKRDLLRAAATVVGGIQRGGPGPSGGGLEPDANRTARAAREAGAAGGGRRAEDGKVRRISPDVPDAGNVHRRGSDVGHGYGPRRGSRDRKSVV